MRLRVLLCILKFVFWRVWDRRFGEWVCAMIGALEIELFPVELVFL